VANITNLLFFNCHFRSTRIALHVENLLIFKSKPNSITLASSELAPNMFEAGSCQIPLLAGSEQAPN